MLAERRALGHRGLELSAQLLDGSLGLGPGGVGGAGLLKQRRDLVPDQLGLGQLSGERLGPGGERVPLVLDRGGSSFGTVELGPKLGKLLAGAGPGGFGFRQPGRRAPPPG